MVRHDEQVDAQHRFRLTPDTLWLLLCLVAPLVVHTVRLTSYLFDGNLPYDTLVTYFPLAKSLRSDPGAFFSNPESVIVPPGTYVYMALGGPNAETLKATNFALSIAVLFMLFGAANRLAGRAAAGGAAWLYVCSPTLAPLAITPQSEPLFLFLVALWLWACVLACSPANGQPSGWARYRAWLLMLIGGLALAAATLTRATYMYWIPVATLVCLGLNFWGPTEKRSYARRLLIIHLVALAGAGAYVVHNQITFKKPIVSTGAGIALYLGNNTVINGFEPPYHGLNYDNFYLTEQLKHISLEGDARLRKAADQMLRDAPIPVLAEMYWDKLGAVLFFSKVRLERHVLNLRAWRMLLLVLSAYGIWTYRRSLPVWMIAGALAYQAVVHVPVLYNPRYTIGALDIILTLLSGFGIGALHRQKRPALAAVACAAAVLACIGLGAYHQRHSAPVMPNLSKGPHALMRRAAIESIEIVGMRGNPMTAVAEVTASRPAIRWKGASLESAGMAIANLGVDTWDSRCNAVVYSFEASDGLRRELNLRLEGLPEHRDIAFGMKDLVDEQRKTDGTLSLTFDCPVGARLRFTELALYHASMGLHYRAHVLGPGK